jgi:PrtD family type I secretion system ABC transporter
MNLGVLRPLLAPLRTVLLFSLVINLALLAPSIFMLQVFDRVLTTRSVETLVVVALIAIGTLALMGVLEFLRTRALSGIGVKLEQEHGPRILAQLMRATARQGGRSYLDGMRDLAVVRTFLGGQGVIAFCDAPWTVIYLALIWMFHPALGLLATLFTGVLIVLAWLNERVSRDTIAQLTESSRKAGRLVDSSLRNAEVITALGMQPAMTGRWQAQTQRSHWLQLDLSRNGGAITALSRFTRQLVQVAMLGYGAYLVIHDNATPGVMLATTIILARAMAPVELLIGSWKSLAEARSAFGRLREVLVAPTEGAVGTDLPRPSGRLAAENLVFTPPGSDRALLRGVSLSAEAGQALAVIGPSGSGKTTLARLLAGVTVPTAGVVRLDGADYRSWDPVRLGAWIGYVPQDVELFDGTVSENIARLGTVDSEAVLEASRAAHVHELLLRLPAGYDTPVGDAGSRISGGQRQRVALARALYGNPALVVMDEPDASLDAEGEAALLETIRGLKQRGVTVIVVTQRRAVLAVADRVVVMKDGTIERIANVEVAQPQQPGQRGGSLPRAS